MKKVSIPEIEVIDWMATELKEKVARLPEDAKLLFVSFQTTTGFQEDLRKVRRKLESKKRDRKVIVFRNPKEKFIVEKGGKVVLFCLLDLRLKPIWEYDSSFASAININIHGLHLGFLKKIVTIKGDDFIVRSHPWFNHIHSIENSFGDSMLITSSGLDLILEIPSSPVEGKPTFAWWAADYGFSSSNPEVEEGLEKNRDYRTDLFGTHDQATHINSAIELEDGNIIATLFHQGEIIKIDRKSGNYKVLVKGLKNLTL